MRYSRALLAATLAVFALTLPSTADAQHAAKGKKKAAESAEVTPSTTPADEAVRAPTPDELAELAAGVQALVNDDPTGLVPVTGADGAVSVDLDGRFMSVAVAVKKDGEVKTSCVNASEDAARLAKPSTTRAAARPAGLEEK